MTALEAARRTADEEKLTALRNAVLNTVAMADLTEHERAVFLQYVAELEPLHIQVLKYAVNPRVWFEERGRPEDIDDNLHMRGLPEGDLGWFDVGCSRFPRASALGHSSVTVTQDLYQHVTPGMQGDATERVAAMLTAR
jgi:hypothetical protein